MRDASNRPLRVLLAIGNPERERHLLGVLEEGGVAVAARCLDGPSLLRLAGSGTADVVLAAAGLHRLGRETLLSLREDGLPVVLLASPAESEPFDDLVFALPPTGEASVIIAALREAVRQGAPDGAANARGDANAGPAAQSDAEVIALICGKGAPGTTTIAIGLAAVLGSSRQNVLLVDADLRGGTVSPLLDLDPRHGLAGLGIASMGRPEAIFDELQDGPGFSVLAGIERAEAQERLTPERVTVALITLQTRFDVIVVDAGETLTGVTSTVSSAFIRSAERVLLVTTADLIGLWNARACLRFVTESLDVPPEAISAVVNRHGGGDEYGAQDVERVLGIRVLAAIPEDRRAARRTRTGHVPITAGGGSAANAVADLATRLAGWAPLDETAPSTDGARWRRWRRQPAEGRR